MKYIKTFESFEDPGKLNEGILDSDVYKFLSDKSNKENIMSVNVPTYIKQALNSKKYKNSDSGKIVDLSDLTEQDYRKAIELGEANKWGNPHSMLGAPKFFKASDEKTKKAYAYIYQRIDMANQGKAAHGFGSGS
jgi:hypothetical protein